MKPPDRTWKFLPRIECQEGWPCVCVDFFGLASQSEAFKYIRFVQMREICQVVCGCAQGRIVSWEDLVPIQNVVLQGKGKTVIDIL